MLHSLREQIDQDKNEMDDIQKIKMLELEVQRLRKALSVQNSEISQILGKALDFPWYFLDQENFTGSTEKCGVCVGDRTAESLAEEAAGKIRMYKDFLEQLHSASSTLLGKN